MGLKWPGCGINHAPPSEHQRVMKE